MPRPRKGRFLGIPYDWTPLTRERLRRSVWNPDEPRLFVPKAYGWGYELNFAALRRLRRGRRA